MAERAFESYSQIGEIRPRHPLTCSVRFSPNGRLLAFGCNGSIPIYVLTSDNTLASFREFICGGGGVTDICFSPDSQFLASSYVCATIQIWDVARGFVVRTLLGHWKTVSCVMYNPQSVVIASGSFDDTILIWDGKSGACLRDLSAQLGGVRALDFNADGSMIVAGGENGGCRIWNPATGNMISTIMEQGTAKVGSVKFSSDGMLVLIGLPNSTLRIWSMEHGLLPTRYSGHVNRTARILSTFIRTNERYFVSGSEDNCIYIWEVTSARLVQIIRQAHAAPVQSITSHPTRDVIASMSPRDIDTIKLWTPNPN